MTRIPAKYKRAGSSKIVGCLVYLVVIPSVALFLALFLAVPIMYALKAVGLSKDRASAPFVVPIIHVELQRLKYPRSESGDPRRL